MTQVIGGVIVTLLVADLLAQEAIAIGLLRAPDSVRRGLTVSAVALAVGFLVAVGVHLATL